MEPGVTHLSIWIDAHTGKAMSQLTRAATHFESRDCSPELGMQTGHHAC